MRTTPDLKEEFDEDLRKKYSIASDAPFSITLQYTYCVRVFVELSKSRKKTEFF